MSDTGKVVLNQVPIDINDTDGNSVTIPKEGNTYFVAVRDSEQLGLLKDIHIELKKITFYLSQVVDQRIEDTDVED